MLRLIKHVFREIFGHKIQTLTIFFWWPDGLDPTSGHFLGRSSMRSLHMYKKGTSLILVHVKQREIIWWTLFNGQGVGTCHHNKSKLIRYWSVRSVGLL